MSAFFDDSHDLKLPGNSTNYWSVQETKVVHSIVSQFSAVNTSEQEPVKVSVSAWFLS